MTVNKAVADELRDRELGVLSRRHAELVQRFSKGHVPKKLVLRQMQQMLDGNFEGHQIRGPYDVSLNYRDNFNFLPSDCHNHFGARHCIEIPDRHQFISHNIFLLTFLSPVTWKEMQSLIEAWGYRPVVSVELVALNRLFPGYELAPDCIVALGSRHTHKIDKEERILVAERFRVHRNYFWRKPEEVNVSDSFAVVEKS